MSLGYAAKKKTFIPPKKEWYRPYLLPFLAMLVIVLYAKSFNLGSTNLDDYFYIFNQEPSNEKWSGVFDAFNEGVGGKKDILYRPLFRVSFVLERQVLFLFDQQKFIQNALFLAHFDNILLHIVNVWLLFFFLMRFSISRLNAFFCSCLFAVHPVLTMAVAWIPGRNEIMLSIFTLWYFINFFNYLETGKRRYILLQAIILLPALFTKEPGVFIPFIALFYLFVFRKNEWKTKKWAVVYLVWALELIFWYAVRASAIEAGYIYPAVSETISTFFSRIPGLIQYIGKIVLPFNLSVYPDIHDTTFVTGSVSLIAFIVLLIYNKNREMKMILFGAAWFLVFIIPSFLTPRNLTDALFEHRLYLPFTGIFFIAGGALHGISKVTLKLRGFIVAAACLISGIIIFNYLPYFNNSLTFFRKAVADSPHSSQASRILGTELVNNGMQDEAVPYFYKALELNPNEFQARYYLATLVYMKEKAYDRAEKLLTEEIKINPFSLESYGSLVYIYFEKKDYNAIKKLMLSYLKLYPGNQSACLNLLISDIELGKKKDAMKDIELCHSLGMGVDSSLIKKAFSIPDSVSEVR